MRRFILSGAPGSGKTVLLRRLEQAGCAVVEEAATDLIALAAARGVAEHWKAAAFIDDIVTLQRARQRRADAWPDEVVVFDRSPVCTWALAEHLGREPTPTLREEMARIERERIYERRVFFLENLGFVTPTEARRITFEDTLKFEATHRDVYRRFGYELISIHAADVETRFAMATALIAGRLDP